MPKNDRERTRKARALMQQRPELNYTRALAEVDAAHAPREQDVDPVLLARIPMRMASSSRNSVGVLPADATPAQRARAEAVWRPVRPDRPCRACGDDEQGDGPCSGLLIHVDRFPGSLSSLVAWNDVYQCADCGEQFDAGIVLEAILWASTRTASRTRRGCLPGRPPPQLPRCFR
jgi:hypothetical protein